MKMTYFPLSSEKAGYSLCPHAFADSVHSSLVPTPFLFILPSIPEKQVWLKGFLVHGEREKTGNEVEQGPSEVSDEFTKS